MPDLTVFLASKLEEIFYGYTFFHGASVDFVDRDLSQTAKVILERLLKIKILLTPITVSATDYVQIDNVNKYILCINTFIIVLVLLDGADISTASKEIVQDLKVFFLGYLNILNEIVKNNPEHCSIDNEALSTDDEWEDL